MKSKLCADNGRPALTGLKDTTELTQTSRRITRYLNTHDETSRGKGMLDTPHSLPFIIQSEYERDLASLFGQWRHNDEPSRFKADECGVQLKTLNVLQFVTTDVKNSHNVCKTSDYFHCWHPVEVFNEISLEKKMGFYPVNTTVYCVTDSYVKITILDSYIKNRNMFRPL